MSKAIFTTSRIAANEEQIAALLTMVAVERRSKHHDVVAQLNRQISSKRTWIKAAHAALAV